MIFIVLTDMNEKEIILPQDYLCQYNALLY